MDLLKQHRGFIIIAALAAVIFANGIWAFKEFVRAESYFGLGSQLMIERGEWLAPHAPDEQVLNKPPLTYWLIGFSYKIFGTSYGAARVPGVIAALCTLGVIYFLGFRFGGVRQGLLATAVLATSFLFLSFARMAMSDMLLTLFVTTSLACFTIVLTSNSVRRNSLVLVGYAALGLGVLTKGPIALVLVAAPIGIELLISRDRSELIKRLRLLPGLMIVLTATAPYFLFVYLRLGVEPLRFFFIGENVQRFTGAIYAWSVRPWWYEFAAFFSDFAPWSLLIPVAVWFDWQRRARTDRSTRMLYLWLVWTVLLFSISNFKLDYYLLPAMPAAALIVGRMVMKSERRVKIVLVLCVAIAVMILTLQMTVGRRFAQFLPVSQLVAGVPADRVWFTSAATTDWANDVAFNLPPPHRVERLIDSDDARLSEVLKTNANSVALIREREYQSLAAKDPEIKILAAGQTYGHGGVNLNMLLHPQRETLLVVGHER
ncbi:MAG TPA: glycosyltransferase family 39 protein [Pyrinomonadaceae bacterium]|nr:glycosyltransferase family 39 protein [Pyrinomonadaceae bacterium]